MFKHIFDHIHVELVVSFYAMLVQALMSVFPRYLLLISGFCALVREMRDILQTHKKSTS